MHVITQCLQKSILERIPKHNRKSTILNFLSDFCAVFAIFRPNNLTNSSNSFNLIIFKFGECNLKAFVTLKRQDVEFSLKGVSSAA